MARDEQTREDMLRDATALVDRIVLRLPDVAVEITIGFRPGGAASIYWGADPVYHFNTRNELRRGFRNGLLLKAQRGQLVQMRRERRPGAVELVSRTLRDEETASIMGEIRALTERLQAAYLGHQFQILGAVPNERCVLRSLGSWLAECAEREMRIATTAGVE